MTTYSSPVPAGCRPTSGFMTRARPDHAGDDFGPPKPGQKRVPIHAVADFTVKKAGTNIMAGHTGKAVWLDHGIHKDQYGADRMESYSGHLASYSVKAGDKGKAGDVIGIMGTTGNSTAIHLHIGVLCNGAFIDPSEWLARKGIIIGKTSPVKPAGGDSGTLKKGSIGKRVLALQKGMNRVFPSYANFAGDSKYGDYTVDVMKDFQRRSGLKQTGTVDLSTLTALAKHGIKL